MLRADSSTDWSRLAIERENRMHALRLHLLNEPETLLASMDAAREALANGKTVTVDQIKAELQRR